MVSIARSWLFFNFNKHLYQPHRLWKASFTHLHSISHLTSTLYSCTMGHGTGPPLSQLHRAQHPPTYWQYVCKAQSWLTKASGNIQWQICQLSFPLSPQTLFPTKPQLSQTFAATKQNLFFHRTDIKNFYWSLLLPPSHSHSFIFAVASPFGQIYNFRFNRPPFGWDYIPAISNTIMTDLLCHLNTETFFSKIYVDDVLSTSTVSAAHCHTHTTTTRNILSSNHLPIHPPGSDKSTSQPSTSTTFVEKHISSGTNPSISNTAQTNLTTLFYAIIATAMPVSLKQIQCMTGHLS